MWGKKKKDEKNQTREYVDGVPQKVPELEIPIPSPEQAVQPQQQQYIPNCVICVDYGFYADNVGVWHHCPRCNPKPMMMSKPEPDTFSETPEVEDSEVMKPLHTNKFCQDCGMTTQVHNKKKEFICDHCQKVQKVSP